MQEICQCCDSRLFDAGKAHKDPLRHSTEGLQIWAPGAKGTRVQLFLQERSKLCSKSIAARIVLWSYALIDIFVLHGFGKPLWKPASRHTVALQSHGARAGRASNGLDGTCQQVPVTEQRETVPGTQHLYDMAGSFSSGTSDRDMISACSFWRASLRETGFRVFL